MKKGISALLSITIVSLSFSAPAFAGDADCDSLAMLRELKGRPKLGQLVAKPANGARNPAGELADAGMQMAQTGPSKEAQILGGTVAVLGLFGALIGESDSDKYSRQPVLLVHDGSLDSACRIIAKNPAVRSSFHAFAEGVFKRIPASQQKSIDPAAVSGAQSVSKASDAPLCLPENSGSGATSASGT